MPYSSGWPQQVNVPCWCHLNSQKSLLGHRRFSNWFDMPLRCCKSYGVVTIQNQLMNFHLLKLIIFRRFRKTSLNIWIKWNCEMNDSEFGIILDHCFFPSGFDMIRLVWSENQRRCPLRHWDFSISSILLADSI